MRIDSPVPVLLVRCSSRLCAGMLPAVMIAAALLATGCGTAGPGVAPAVPPAASDAKQASVDGRPQVLLPGAGDNGGDLAIALPAWPEERDLILLQQGVRADLRFWVDQRSLELVAGGEVRYTFVARSASGARSVTFEAMRCGSRERIILATGSVDGRWVPVRAPGWNPIDRQDPTGMREVLHRDIFCPARLPVASLQELRSALKAGIHPRAVRD
ncbi:MAG: hypothetical protein ING77_16995 [Rhodocyclaceae bacterium]|jgi:hypothetical protein|nr:hypothetical protein [Rhodocyclaceae bacterium]